MPGEVSFLGAAKSVTGSQYLLEANGARLLIDCGLYQERALLERNWAPFPVPPETIDAVLLTHAHLDHSGLIPKLVRDGFRGPIYGTAATSEITKIMLMDSASLQMEDAEFKRQRHEREKRKGPHPEIPLYTTDDAQAAFARFAAVNYWDTVEVGDGVEVTFHDAGHVLGSSMLRIKIRDNGREQIVVFPGDIGRWDKPILHDPTRFPEADYALVESTYGDRLHEPTGEVISRLTEYINLTVRKGGNIIIPSFALERTQELMYCLYQLLSERLIPRLKIFVDSPMANSITQIFEQHPELFNAEMLGFVLQGRSPFDFPGLSLVRTVEESRTVNDVKEPVIIIAGSGMCTGGRIKHHLVNNISRPDSMVLFVGYQAVGTLGRQIVDGAEEVRILGKYYPVRARIVQASVFSGHADRDELLRWLSGFQRPPKRLFVTHGDANVTERFAGHVREQRGWEVVVPEYADTFALD
ncbi:MAG: MBL fold metallo-hydrolase [Chloroflexi bacterium]|nr:MBL fold metallo-hydrolase [Chloroflexota bacterium]